MPDEYSLSRDTRVKRDVLRQACDACRTRKARCHSREAPQSGFGSAESGLGKDRNDPRSISCQRCLRLGLECTYQLPFGVRGPRRRTPAQRTPETSSSGRVNSELSTSNTNLTTNDSVHPSAELYLVSSGSGSIPSDSQQWPLSPHTVSTHRSPSTSYVQTSIGEEFCTKDLLKRILSDYLEHLYPLIPVVHRPTFHRDLCENRDLYDDDFFGLILSLSAVTVGTMPNRFKEYKACATPLRFRTRTEMIRYCHDRVHCLRGHDFFENINYNKWAASYLLGIALFQIGEHNQARMIEVESMQLARLLGLHQISEYAGLNCIEAQLRKKAFWLMFYGYVHAQYQNLRKERLTYLDANILAYLNLEQLMPLEVDDEYIDEHKVLAQPEGVISVVVGFNTASRVFWTALQSPTAEPGDCYCEKSRSSLAQYHHLKSRLHELRYMLDSLPPQLRQWQSTGDDPNLYGPDPENSRILHAQYATTRANIHVTHLWLQSILLDQVDAILLNPSICEKLGPSVPDHQARWIEREHICRQLLHVLWNIPDVFLEPNGHHLLSLTRTTLHSRRLIILLQTYKVRDVAVGLFTCPFEPHTDAGKRAAEYLREFANKLSSLDGSEMPNLLSRQSWVDTDRTYLKRTH